MSAPFYPQINLGSLAALMAIKQQREARDDYFADVACPYDEDTREQLEKLLAPKTIEVEVEKIVEKIVEKKVEVVVDAAKGGGKRGPKIKSSGVDMDAVATEIQNIRDELKQLKLDSKSLQTADKIQIIKTRATLVEKLIDMDSKVNNQRKMGTFMSLTLTILDDLIPEEGRQEFMKRLEPLAAAD
jgi:hypothetical protein